MEIALVSDTHLPRFGRALPRALVAGLAEARVGLILHAGDWTSPLAVELLEAIAPTQGVAGNNDAPELLERFGTRRIVVVEGVRFGITHGHLGRGRTTADRAVDAFDDEPALDGIVFGHSHVPLLRRLPDGRWLMNPGSPTDRRRQPHFSWALATVTGGEIASVLLMTYDDRGA